MMATMTNKYDVPKEDVREVVSKKLNTTNFDIKEFGIKILTEKNGLLCEHALLNVTVIEKETENERNLSFFVKYYPREEKQAEFVETTGAFRKEIFVYDLFDSFKKENITIISECVAKCYLHEDKHYMIFDDLNTEGLKLASKHEYLDEENLLVLLNFLAKLHTASIVYEENKSKELGRSYRLSEDYQEQFKETFFDKEIVVTTTSSALLSTIDLFKYPDLLENGKNFKEEVKKIFPKIIELSKASEKYRNVLCHGDLWSTNFLFKYINDQPTSCKFVDFQCARYAPPAHDVLFLIYSTTSRKFRKEQLYRILGMYYSFLENHMKDSAFDINEILPFKEFLESCEEQKTLGILSAATCLNLCLVNNDFLIEIFNDEKMYQKCFRENRVHLVKAYIDKNMDKLYETRIRETIEDVKELCESKDI